MLSFMPYSQRLFHLLQASWCALLKVTSYIFTLPLRFLALKSPDFGLGHICRGCGECSTCTPCPMTTPTPAPEISRLEPRPLLFRFRFQLPRRLTSWRHRRPNQRSTNALCASASLAVRRRPWAATTTVARRSYATPPAWTASPIRSTATVSTKHFVLFPQMLRSVGLPFIPHVM